MSRHHEHQLKNKTKSIKAELEAKQETQEVIQAIKADLLEHNNVVKLHAPAEPPPEQEEGAAQGGGKASEQPVPHYIKAEVTFARRPLDTLKDIDAAKHSGASINAYEEASELIAAPLDMMVRLQRQWIDMALGNWRKFFSNYDEAASSVQSKKNSLEENQSYRAGTWPR